MAAAKSNRLQASSTAARAASSRARIQRSSSTAGRERRGRPLGVLEDQARDVPELDRELASLLDRLRRVADVLRRRHLEQAVPRRIGAVRLDRLHRVDPRAEALRHPPPVGREDRRRDDHVRERDLAEQEEAGEDHPVLPEADDLARRDVDVARVVALELRRLLRPAERRERPERRREPRVEHVGVALELRRAALGARLGRRPRARPVPVRARPDRDLVAPPELARDAPVGRLLERLDREPVLALRVVADAPLAQRLDRRAARARPSGTTTAARRAARSASGSARTSRPSAGTARASRAGPRSSSQATIRSSASFWSSPSKPSATIRPSGPDHRQRLEAVVAADLEVHRVVPRRDLDRAGAELRLDPLVGDRRARGARRPGRPPRGRPRPR